MAHTETSKLLAISYTCDATNCREALNEHTVTPGQRITRNDLERTPEVWREESAARDRMEVLFYQAGWTKWVSRGVRHYCPQHGPKPGHKMRRINIRSHLAHLVDGDQ